MATKMQLHRGTAAEWASANPILADGELGFERDTQIIRIGDGVTHWNSLGVPYIPKSVITTVGDLLVASGAKTPARLARGTTGQRLTVNSDGSLGWTAMPDVSSVQSVVNANANYAMKTNENATDGSLETISHAASTYMRTDTATTQHALYETGPHMDTLYVSKVNASLLYEPKWTCKIKSSPTTRTSIAVIAADPDLVVPVITGGVYIFEMTLFITGISSGDFKLGMTSGIASSWHAGVHGPSVGIPSGTAEDVINHRVIGTGNNEPTSLDIGTADGAYTFVTVKGTVSVATSGNFGLAWSQATSAGAPGTQVLFGSSMKAVRVA